MHPWNALVLSLTTALALAPTGGCAAKTIPASAVMVSGGEGRTAYVAQDDGSVYLYDVTLKRRVFGATLKRGELVKVAPAENTIELAGNAVDHKTPLSADHTYRLYFDRAG